MTISIIAAVLALVLFLLAIGAYNKLIRLRNAAEEGFGQIDVQLQRRNDLIPNLVETVKGYASHERQALEAVISARAKGMGAGTVGEKAAADSALTGALRQLLAIAEAYPDLKANTNFLSLQEELAGTENKIGFARQRYNDQVRVLNVAVETIPTNLIANLFKINRAEYFEADESARSVPQVKF